MTRQMRNIKTPPVMPTGWAELRPLIERRLKRGWRQADVAAAADIQASTISRAERGAGPVSVTLIHKYREALARLQKARAPRSLRGGRR